MSAISNVIVTGAADVNAVINGRFLVDQLRAYGQIIVAGAAGLVTTKMADCWSVIQRDIPAVNHAMITSANGVSGSGTLNALRVSQTAGNNVANADSEFWFQQRIEKKFCAQFSETGIPGQSSGAVLSFLFFALDQFIPDGTEGYIGVTVKHNFANPAANVYVSRHRVRWGQSPTRVVVPIAFPQNMDPAGEAYLAGTPNTWGLEIGIHFKPSPNNSAATVLNQWQILGANNWIAPNITDFLRQPGSASTDVWISDVSLVPAFAAQGQFVRTWQDELNLCRRYYQKSFDHNQVPVTASGTFSGSAAYAASNAGVVFHGEGIRFSQEMVAAPVLAFFNPISNNANWYNGNRAADSGAASNILTNGPNGFHVGNPQVAADAVGQALNVHWSADARLS